MKQAESHSITHLLARLRSDDRTAHQVAARQIWDKYFTKLLTLARRHLAAGVRRTIDEEDVLQSMYSSFCARQQRGEFELANRNDLWRLLVSITEHKAKSAATRQGRGKRDYRREASPQPKAGAESRDSPLDLAPSVGPTPAEAVILVDELECRLNALDEPLRRLALWKLAGFTNDEIATKGMMDCAVRTVERKLALIRDRWVEASP